MKQLYKRFKPIIAVVIILLTLAVFVRYIVRHPELLRQLAKLPVATVVGLLALYLVFLLTLTWIQRETLRLCEVSLGRKESMLLVMYSSIINFFGPLQSGPAFRAAYLKKKHNANLKAYAIATILYYGFFGLASLILIAAYALHLWSIAIIIAMVAAGPLLLRRFPQLLPARFRNLQIARIGNLAAATFAQVSVVAVIFYIELNSLGQHVAAIPSLIYTGSANLALFVSITPGAIGFREAFVAATSRLHHLSHSQIISASLIDRGIYIIFMALLALAVFGLHAQTQLTKVTKE